MRGGYSEVDADFRSGGLLQWLPRPPVGFVDDFPSNFVGPRRPLFDPRSNRRDLVRGKPRTFRRHFQVAPLDDEPQQRAAGGVAGNDIRCEQLAAVETPPRERRDDSRSAASRGRGSRSSAVQNRLHVGDKVDRSVTCIRGENRLRGAPGYRD